jgi:regulator of sigma E protease
MSVILFIILLAVLILVHELGHFLAAKWGKVRVDEFGIGFPPKIWWTKKGETTYSVNAIPFGGFVKIFGENPDEDSIGGEDSRRSMVNRPKYIQSMILAAGVAFNIIFAWILISGGFMSGLPTPVSYGGNVPVKNPRLVIVAVAPGSPAEEAGLKAGDRIEEVKTAGFILEELSPEGVSAFIEKHNDDEVLVDYERGSMTGEAKMFPAEGITAGKKAIGISMDLIGTLKLPVHLAFWEGAKTTASLTSAVTVGIVHFIGDVFTGKGSLNQVTGPVGIVGLVGNVTELGFIYLLSLAAFISINLAIVNLLPFPALDGGRLIFLAIESIKGSRINPKIANGLNAVGFIILIIFMIVVTVHDVARIF